MKTFMQFSQDEDQRTTTRPSVSTLRRHRLREQRNDRQRRVLAEIERHTQGLLNSPFVADSDKRQAFTAQLLAKLVAAERK
jgi:hypothetical protein